MTPIVDMTAVIAKAAELNNNLGEVQKAIKACASTKCRLKKQPGRADYQTLMTACLQEEQLLKNVKSYLSQEPKKTVMHLDADDIADMSYDEIVRAIRSVQSKKTHTKWSDDCERDKDGNFIPGSGPAYKEACRIEQMLIDRKLELKPNAAGFSKASLRELIDTLRVCSDLDVTTCLDRIEAFINGGETE